MTTNTSQTDAALTSQPNTPPAGRYTIDPVPTFLLFFARHLVVGRVVGRVQLIEGTLITADNPANWSVRAKIDAASITTGYAERDADLRGADFFDIRQFPTINFEGHGVRPADDQWLMDGALTIRGVGVAVGLKFEFRGLDTGQSARAGFHAATEVRRADFGMKRDLLAEIGRSTTPDVSIEIEAEAILEQ